MRERKAPRYQGTITSWKDEQGFGFIAPNGGGPAVFVHIKAFARRGVRPTDNAIVTYELGVNDRGQPRAVNVAYVHDQSMRHEAAARRKRAPIAALGFLAALAVLTVAAILPRVVLYLYLGMSTFTFFTYHLDKMAAENGRRRTSERRLHWLALLGGWPGALLGQWSAQHKTSKASFQSTFRWTVALNCGVLLWLLSPYGADTIRALLGMQ
jgi:uncharacterized membrane protein YsdA (DUF1294 family)/cold shock CspA family protein